MVSTTLPVSLITSYPHSRTVYQCMMAWLIAALCLGCQPACMHLPALLAVWLGAYCGVSACWRRSEEEMAEEKAGYERKFLTPLSAARYGYLDDIIQPSATRARICAELALLRGKKVETPFKKHSNMPL
jgi:hypothetical protein